MKKIFLFLLLACGFFSFESSAQINDQGVVIGTDSQNKKDIEVEKQKPIFSNRIISEVGFDDNYQTTDRRGEYKDTYGRVRFYSKLQVADHISINSYLKLDRIDNQSEVNRRVSSATGGGNRSFENLGGAIQELTIVNDTKNYALIAGKFGLDFGKAWRWDKGLWLYTLPTNYQQNNKLGVSATYRTGDSKETGQYSFGFSTFTNDRKNLDNSILVNQDSAHKSDANAGDTRSLGSYNISVNIKFDFAEDEKLSYNFSYMNLSVNGKYIAQTPQSKIADQKAYVAGMNYIYPISENISLDSLIEYVNIKNFGGNSDATDSYATINTTARFYKNWLLFAGNSNRKLVQIDQNGIDKNLSEISFGYEFGKNDFFDKIVVMAGYKNQRTNNKTSLDTQNAVGALARFYKNF